MKKLLLCIGLFVIALASFAEKRALIIGISDYPDPVNNGWDKLNTDYDIVSIKETLLRRGFSEKNIIILKDDAATREGILNSLADLENKINTGDIVFIHFSGHGVQIEDDNSEENDGLDECLVPYGARYSEDANEHDKIVKGYLRDDDFGNWITKIASKCGKNGDILVTLDACHSGTGTRGILKPRGGKLPLLKTISTKNISQARGNVKSEKLIDGDKNPQNFASITVISASLSDQLNFETYDDGSTPPKPMGSLSYSISKALLQVDSNSTYEGLFSNVLSFMSSKAPNQTPVLETSTPNLSVFGGQILPKPTYFVISQKIGNRFILNGGTLNNITVGSKVLIYKSDFNTSDHPIDTGIVVKSNNFTCEFELLNKQLIDFKRVWVVLNEKNLANFKLNVFNSSTDKNLEDFLKKYSFIQLVGDKQLADIYLLKDGVNTYSFINPSSGLLYCTKMGFNSEIEKLAFEKKLNFFGKYFFVKQLENQSKSFNCEVTLHRVKNGKTDSLPCNKFFVGDTLEFRIVNKGNETFISIIDLQPDGLINKLLPDYRSVVQDFRIPRGFHGSLTKKILIAPPTGIEIFKVILTMYPINLDALTNSQFRGKGKGFGNQIEEIFRASNEPNKLISTRGGIPVDDNEDNSTIFNIPFEIVNLN